MAHDVTVDGGHEDHDHVIDTGKGTLSLDQLGPLLPGMAEIMPLVGGRVWRCYYAARARNRRLAAFQLKEAVMLLEKASYLRPRYAENIAAFVGGEVALLATAIDAEAWDDVEAAFQSLVQAANAYHDLYDKAFLRWKMPDVPPPDLELAPRQ
jgi:hypothetical protein